VDDAAFLSVYSSFDGRRTIGEVRSGVTSSFPAVTEDVFMEIVAILFRLGLLICGHGETPEKEAGKTDA